MKVFVVLPAYNEERMLGWVIRRIKSISSPEYNLEIIVIDDGSTDKTVEIARSEGADSVYSHKRNRGLGASIQTGINFALQKDAEAICILDADGQFLPSDIPKIVNPIREGKADLVLGARFNSGSGIRMISPIKLVGNKLFSLLVSMIILHRLKDTQTGFRALSRSSAKNLHLKGTYNCSQEMVLDLGLKGYSIIEIPIHVRYFANRKSRVIKKTWLYVIKVLKLIISKILFMSWVLPGIILIISSLSLVCILLLFLF